MSEPSSLLAGTAPSDAEIRSIRPILREAERRAERIVAWARLLVVAGFLAFTLLTERFDAAPDAPAIPGQLAIALGTMFTAGALSVVSLILTHPRRFRPWMSWLFALADLGFCLGSLVLTLLNTGFPGNYLPVAPPAWLILLALTFTLMRVNPRIQAVVGIICIAMLVWLWTWPGEVNHDVVDALLAPTPSLIRLLVVAFAAALFVWIAARVRTLIIRALSEGRRKANLTRFLPRDIASAVELSGTGGLDAREIDATIMFIDIRGFTTATRGASPSEVARLLARFRAIVIDVIDAHEGIVDKFIGDGALVVFGAGAQTADSGNVALAAALDLATRVGAWDQERRGDGEPPIRIGMGLHRGPVLSGTIGDERRLEFTVLGDTVNIASRLEAHSKACGTSIVLSATVVADLPPNKAAKLARLDGAPPRDVPDDLALYTLATDADGG